MPRPRVMFDHDARHPLIYMYEPPMYREELEAGVDELVGTPVEALMLTLGDIHTLMYDSRAGQLWGQGTPEWPHAIWRRAHQNFRKLIDEGNDPLRVLCERAHAKDMMLYPSLLVQQGGRERMLQSWKKKGFGPDDWQTDLQPLEIGAQGGVEPDWPGYRARDFMREEVREQTLAVVEEVVRNYAVDGFELQLNYEPYFFHPKDVSAGRQVMTDWIGRVYAAVKQSDPERELVLHFPGDVHSARAVGLDPMAWIERGIADVLVPEAGGLSDQPDAAADFRPLVEAVSHSSCRIHAALPSRVSTDRIGEATIEMARATACNYWDQGIDGIYLAHWFGCWPYRPDFYEKLREVAHPDIMAARDKVYRLPTETNAPPRPVHVPRKANPLPVALEPGEPVRLALRISDDLRRWGDMGRVHQVLLRVRLTGTSELDRVGWRLNGAELPEPLLRRINEMYRMSSPLYRVFGQWYVFELDDAHWPVRGDNALEIELLHRDPGLLVEAGIRDVELEIKYLMGASFHRGFVDLDLGPYERAVS